LAPTWCGRRLVEFRRPAEWDVSGADGPFHLRPFLASRPGAALQAAVVAAAALLVPGRLWFSPIVAALVAAAMLWLAGDGLRAAGFGRPMRRAFWWLSVALAAGLAWQYAASGFLLLYLSQRLGAAASAPAPSTALGFIAAFIVFGLIHPTASALAYRGFLLSRLERLFGHSIAGAAASFIVASVVFGLGSAGGGWARLVVTCITGGVFNAIYYWYRRNVWPSVVAHAVYNIIAIVLLSL
jgi:membrane protease YdiL (CAAX protease family)